MRVSDSTFESVTHRVVIVGGGFGGLFCARRLGRADVEVTLLDRAACHVFQPLLYQCATGTLSIGQISRSLREELARHRNVTTLLGEAFDLDADTTTPGLGYASLYVGIAYGDPTTPQVDIDELRVGRVPTPCAP